MQISTALNVPNVIMRAIRTWSPSKLFANSEEGVWYDPSDLTTMYQDSAGTTPVTAVEQPVGKMLDKSGNGNHAIQATSAARPTLSARVNKLTKTEQFDDAAWTKSNTTVTANAAVAPDGTTTAEQYQESAISASHLLYPTWSNTSGVSYCYSMYVKKGDGATAPDWIQLGARSGTISLNKGWVNLNITTLAVGNVGPTPFDETPTIEDVGSGWRRLTLKFTANVSGSTGGFIVTFTNDTDSATVAPTYLGVTTSDIYVWGASLVTADQASLPYQRVNTATDYDTSSVFPRYLKFDGVDDRLATSAIDFSAGDKMTVFAGVRKLSDAAAGTVAELSATIATNAGTFLLTAPNSAAANYNWSSKGTTQVDNVVTTYTAPLTNVITGIGDISGPTNSVRVNGGTATTVGTTQGTGNFGNYPLYIGRRGGTTLPFNGHLYSLIVRAAESTATDITDAETWVNGKTGAY